MMEQKIMVEAEQVFFMANNSYGMEEKLSKRIKV